MTALRTLSGDSLAKYLNLYCASRRLEPSQVKTDDPLFEQFLNEKGATGKGPPSNDPKEREFFDHLTRLAPDWERRRRLGNVRMKTFLRIYLSKWFWKGLEWQETEFLLILLDRTRDESLNLIRGEPSLLQRIGFHCCAEETLRDRRTDINLKGWNLLGWQDLLPYIYTEPDFDAVWKLRSVQSMRDHIFIRVTGHEHEGKLGIKKNRIRGYRDGKSSPRDLTRTALARKVDQMFYEDKFYAKWDALELELKRYGST
jgi:hypothetical protein